MIKWHGPQTSLDCDSVRRLQSFTVAVTSCYYLSSAIQRKIKAVAQIYLDANIVRDCIEQTRC